MHVGTPYTVTQYHEVVSLIKCYVRQVVFVRGTACAAKIRKLERRVLSCEINAGLSVTKSSVS